MEESFPFRYTLCEYLFTLVGLVFFLLDIALDIWTVVSLYQEGLYVSMGLMVFLLLGSSVLLQVFSWYWYSDSLENLETKVEKFAKGHTLIKPFHFLQLGVYLRYAGVIEISTTYFIYQTDTFKEGMAVYLSHDLQMLRLFEAFTESAPQLTLMMTVILQKGELKLFTGLKILSSAAAIASTVAMYHRSMRAFLKEKHKIGWISTGFYFLWNLLLIIPRLSALGLFCSILPHYIIAHFLSLWMVLVLVAWSQKTNHMENRRWEWLYRATVGIIWYFSWFNVSSGKIKIKMAVYYGLMGLDTTLLLGFWWWKVDEYAGCWSSLNPIIVIPTLASSFVLGILVTMMYYTWFHPNCDKQKLSEPSANVMLRRAAACVEADADVSERDSPEPPASSPQEVTRVLKRSRAMAANFF